MKHTSKITTKVKIIGGLLSLVILIIIVLGIVVSNKSERDSFVINIAGKQRMLSQKITKDIFFIKATDSFDFIDLDRSIEEFAFNLYALKDGNQNLDIDSPPTPEIEAKLEEVVKIWKPFLEKIELLKSSLRQIKQDKELFLGKVNFLLTISDKIVKQMVENQLPGSYIDLSGRQRMLSQRMTLYFNHYLKTDNEQDFYIFVNAQKLYEITITNFVNDNIIKQKETLFKLVKENYDFWKSYNLFLNSLMKKEKQINEFIAYTHQNNIKLLNTMDEAVWLFTENSEDRINFLKNFQYFAGTIALLIMFYSFLLTRELEDHINIFVKKAKDLASTEISDTKDVHFDFACEEELKEASHHINQFAKKVNNAMSHSEEAVKKAEMAINELQMISDEVEDTIRDFKLSEEEQRNIDKSLDSTEDIAIESTENLLHVSKMLKTLQKNLDNITHIYENKENKKKDD